MCDHEAYIYDPQAEVWYCRDCDYHASVMDAIQVHFIGDRIQGHVNDEYQTEIEGIIEGIEYDDGYLNKVRILSYTGNPQEHMRHNDSYIYLWDFEIDQTITYGRRHHFEA